jgi:cellulose synthase/poly-beta-1,6-N-acetylglucosamine synthase-like glycosyltransferase
LTVVDKVNGGKADALNAGLNVATYPLVCSIDADTLVDRNALLEVVIPFMDDPERTIAAGGTIRTANGCTVSDGAVTRIGLPRRLLPLIQVVEYLRAFLFGRLGWNRLGGNLIISGAFGLFRKDAVEAVGGYRSDTVGEDMELVVRLHRHFREAGMPYRVVFVPTPVCYTEVPENTRTLSRQRDRWQRGLADTLWRHRSMLLSPRYGMVGMVAMPYFVLVELLGPVIELCGLVVVTAQAALGLVDVQFMALYFTMSFFFGTFQSCAAILLDELTFTIYRSPGSLWRLVLAAFVENLGYRQLTLAWRVQGMIRHARGARSWGAMERTGFGQVAAPAGQ